MAMEATGEARATKDEFWKSKSLDETTAAMYPDGTTPEQIKAHMASKKAMAEAIQNNPALMAKTAEAAHSAGRAMSGNLDPANSVSNMTRLETVDQLDWQGIISEFTGGSSQSKGPPPLDCGTIMARAYQYYSDVNGSPKLKPYKVPPGETPGMVAARVPRLGDIAYCRGK